MWSLRNSVGVVDEVAADLVDKSIKNAFVIGNLTQAEVMALRCRIPYFDAYTTVPAFAFED